MEALIRILIKGDLGARVEADILALLAAIGWAINGILVRKGSRYSSVTSAVFLSLLATVSFLWSIGRWYFPAGFTHSPALLYFVLGGVIQPAFVRFLNYTGISRLGVSRSQSIRAVTPLFASIIALVVLHERPGTKVYLAILLTVIGIALVSYRREGESDWRGFDLLFPLSAAVLGAFSQNLRKAGLLILHNPLVAAAITTSTSLAAFALVMWISGNIRSLCPSRRSLPFYGTAALISMTSQILSFAALSQGDVSVIVTLTSTSPLFTVAFSSIFLRDQEKVDLMVVTGVLNMVVAILIILNR
jgi:drug/metabolite transporter (DMT)-like permease